MDPVSKAQSETPQKRRLLYGGHDPSIGRATQIKPGEVRNPGGRPRKQRITKIYEKILRSAKNRKDIEESILATLTSGKMAAVLLLREAAERTEGRVTQEIELSGSIQALSDEELTKRITAKLQKLNEPFTRTA
jgi:hypothetical protein